MTSILDIPENASDEGVASDAGTIRIRFDPGSNLRSIASEYLDDPDLWPIILQLNGIADLSDLTAGQELLIPGDQVRTAATALDTSLSEIQKANEAGAQLFAPIMIRNAIDFRDKAVIENLNGIYGESILLSSQSITSAETARQTSEQLRDIAAEARLADRQGWVEGQNIEENSWSERPLNAILQEEEKLRTLSRSTAQVVFRDASRLRLNANSQAVIQRMRVDPLKRREESKISLVKGDFYALLASETSRNRMEVALPSADATIDSGSFWVSQDESGAKFSNYDVKPVEIEARGQSLVLGRNEGAFVRSGQQPTGKVDVIGKVELEQPEDDSIVYGSAVTLGWQASPTNSGYWLEIAFDSRFDRMADSQFGLKSNVTDAIDLAPGTYYWRVAALDNFGLPGPMSSARKFELQTDTTPPFLRIRTPEPEALLRDAAVTVSGETEANAAVSVNGDVADVDADGRFFLTIDAAEGQNEITIIARDTAGNETTRETIFSYVPDRKRDIRYDADLPRGAEGRFLTANRELTLSGRVIGGAKVSVLDAAGNPRAETYAEDDGRFNVNIPVTRDEERLQIRITTVSGYAYEEDITAAILDEPPVVRFEPPLPRFTADRDMTFSVNAGEGVTMTANGEAGTISGGVTSFTLAMSPGPNSIEVVATNAVGVVTIEKRTVVFDGEKPEITTSEIAVEQRGETEVVTVGVGARDATGLSKTARVTVTAGGGSREGVLRFNRARKSYQGFVEVPRRGDGEPITIEIELADIAGNINRLEMVQ